MINGGDQILYIRTSTLQAFEPVGCLSSNSLSEESETINTTTRDNKGWMTIIPQRQRYNVSFNGLVEKERVLNRLTYSDLANIKRLEKKILWKVVGGEETIIGSGYIQTLEDNSEVESMVGFSATIVGTGRTYLGSDARVTELRGQLNGFSTFNALLRDIRAFIPLEGRMSGESIFLANLESAAEALLMQGNLNGQSLFLAELKKFITIKQLEGSFDGNSLFDAILTTPKVFTQLQGSLNGNSNFQAVLSIVYVLKALSAINNIDYDIDAYIQRVISNGGDIDNGACLEEFIGEFTDSGGVDGRSIMRSVLTKVAQTTWTPLSVDNRGVTAPITSCLNGVANDTFYSLSTNVALGSVLYNSQSTNDKVVGGNLWYFVDDLVNFSIQINNNGVVMAFIPCS